MKKSNKYFIDLFAGCGGMSLGLEQAGFIPLLYNEINDSAARTYKKNVENKYDNEPIFIKDIKDLTKEVILTHRRKWKKEGKEVDLVGYKYHILHGAIENNLPYEYISFIDSVNADVDPDVNRATVELSIYKD